MINFRHPIESDLQTIIDLTSNKQELFFVGPHGEFPLNKERIKHLIAVRTQPTVAIFDGKVIGFACISDLILGKSGTICNVVIGNSYRRKGFGKLLLEYMIYTAMNNYKLQEIHIAVFNTNTQAVLLYHSIGFVPFDIKVMKDFDNKKIALLYMKILAKNR